MDDALHYQTDVAATIIELVGGEVPALWDGRSFAESFRAGESRGRDSVVFGQNCWACQRSVRWEDYVYIRTYHTGLKNLPERMLFNVADDPHELNGLAAGNGELADRGQALIEKWTGDMMASSEYAEDQMWTVMREGGPYHTRNKVTSYCQRLRETHRAHHAEFLEAHPTGLL